MRWQPHEAPTLPLAVTESLLRQQLALAPHDADLVLGLSQTLRQLARWDEALAVIDSLDPEHPHRVNSRGSILLDAGRPALAVSALEQAQLAGVSKVAWQLGLAVSRRDGGSAAQPIFEQILADDPRAAAALMHWGVQAISDGHAAEVDRRCEELSAAGIVNAGLLAVWASAKAALDDADAVSALVRHDLIHHAPLGVAPEFNAALSAEILNHPNRVLAPTPTATVGGTRIDEPLCLGADRFRELVPMLQTAIDTYTAELPAGVTQSLQSDVPMRLRIWSIQLQGNDFESSHIHPTAIISGVYYVQLPPLNDHGAQPGALVFELLGDVDNDLARRCTRTITPVEGEVVLFPSSFAHRTVPTRTDSVRISVAFDMVPA